MNTLLIIGASIVILALIAYSIGIINERSQSVLKKLNSFSDNSHRVEVHLLLTCSEASNGMLQAAGWFEHKLDQLYYSRDGILKHRCMLVKHLGHPVLLSNLLQEQVCEIVKDRSPSSVTEETCLNEHKV